MNENNNFVEIDFGNGEEQPDQNQFVEIDFGNGEEQPAQDQFVEIDFGNGEEQPAQNQFVEIDSGNSEEQAKTTTPSTNIIYFINGEEKGLKVINENQNSNSNRIYTTKIEVVPLNNTIKSEDVILVSEKEFINIALQGIYPNYVSENLDKNYFELDVKDTSKDIRSELIKLINEDENLEPEKRELYFTLLDTCERTMLEILAGKQ